MFILILKGINLVSSGMQPLLLHVICFLFYMFSIYTENFRNAAPEYNESHLYMYCKTDYMRRKNKY
jgi:hypothetical protein